MSLETHRRIKETRVGTMLGAAVTLKEILVASTRIRAAILMGKAKGGEVMELVLDGIGQDWPVHLIHHQHKDRIRTLVKVMFLVLKLDFTLLGLFSLPLPASISTRLGIKVTIERREPQALGKSILLALG